jgi:hypothetical protein
VERFVRVTEKIFSKLLEVVTQDQKDFDFFKKKILNYSVSRILPSMRSDNFAQDSNILLQNLVLMHNYFHLLTNLLLPSKGLFTDQLLDLSKRLSYLSNALTQACLASFEQLPTFSAVLCSQDLKEYGLALDELSEDLSYRGL